MRAHHFTQGEGRVSEQPLRNDGSPDVSDAANDAPATDPHVGQLPPIQTSSFLDSFQGPERQSFELPLVHSNEGTSSSATWQGINRGSKPHQQKQLDGQYMIGISQDPVQDSFSASGKERNAVQFPNANSTTLLNDTVSSSSRRNSAISSPNSSLNTGASAHQKFNVGTTPTTQTTGTGSRADQARLLSGVRRAPPVPLDLESPNRAAYGSSANTVFGGTASSHRRVTEPHRVSQNQVSNGFVAHFDTLVDK